MLLQQNSHAEVVRRAHELGKKVIAGGPYPTSYRDKVDADHLVLGEAEITLEPFVRDFVAGRARRVYDAREVERPTVELTLEGKPLLDKTPIPRWDLLDIKNYFSWAVQYSRGCPFNCEFCDITKLFGNESRTKSPQQFLAELDFLYGLGWRGPVFVVDDNFFGNAKNVKQMLPELREWQERRGFPNTFFTEVSSNLGLESNKAFMEGMVGAGFDQVFVGIESIDPDVTEGMNKKQNRGDMLAKIRRMQRAGLEVTGGFIIGADREKPTVFKDLFEFIQESGIVVPMPGLLTALKGTDLYHRLEGEGRLLGESSGNNTHDLGFNFRTELDADFLIEGYRGLLEDLFDSKNYYARCRVLAANRGPRHRLKRADASGLRAFGKIVYDNLRRPNWEFIKYAVGTAVRRPSEFPEAIASEVKRTHFGTMTRATFDVQDYQRKTETLAEQFRTKMREVRGSTQEVLRKVEDWSESILELLTGNIVRFTKISGRAQKARWMV
jgi:radical SAM superfamily enzyme YgiQ (UPF0313 family)